MKTSIKSYVSYISIASIIGIAGFIAGCGGGGSAGVKSQAVTPAEYEQAAVALRMSPKPVSQDDHFVYHFSLSGAGRAAAFQAELKYDPAAVTIQSVRTVGPMAEGISALNDHGDGTAIVAAVSSRSLEAGGAILEVVAASQAGEPGAGAVSITGYEITNIEGKRMGESSLGRAAKRRADPSQTYDAACGDVDGDGQVSETDVSAALQVAVGARQAGEIEMYAGDMAPMDTPDSILSVADAELILRRVNELGVYGCGTPGTIIARPFSEAKISIDADTNEKIVSDSLIVMFRNGVTAEMADDIAAAHNMNAVGRNSFTGTWEFRVEEGSRRATMAQLASNPSIASVETNPVVSAVLTPNDLSFTISLDLFRWGYVKIQAPEAWDITTGAAGTTIAVVDTGVDTTHPEFTGRIAAGYNFVSNNTNAMDDNGHGTHVTGIAAGEGNNGIGMAGGCWKCRIMPVKVLDANGSGSLYAVQSGITWAAQHDARVINVSLGGFARPKQSDITTIQNARAQGAVVVVAAGNSNFNASRFTPAGVPEAFTVGSTSSTDQRSYFSNFGDDVDIAAPGEYIYSTMPTYRVTLNDQGYGMNYEFLSGTSMATPMVSGIAGLIFSLNPGFTPDDVENILLSNTDPITTDKPIGDRLNAFKSVSAAGGGPVITNQPPSVFLTANPSSGTVPLTVEFNAACTDPDGTCDTYDWDFGDGATTSTTGNVTSHEYTTAGAWDVNVTVTDNQGAQASANTQVVVSSTPAENQPPVVTISASTTSGPAPLTVKFTGSAYDPDGTIVNAFWNYGDGATDPLKGKVTRHTYTAPGTYEASLTAVDGQGATTKESVTITVTP